MKSILINEGVNSEEIGSQQLPYQDGVLHHRRIDAKTDSGVRLGMTPAQVQSILGKPAKEMHSKKFNAFELIYRRVLPKDENEIEWQYSNFYLFRNERLYFIELSRDAIGGG